MIIIQGQSRFEFSLGDELQDFIDADNLEVFKSISHAGNILPVCELSFTHTSDRILDILNEGNPLIISIGRDHPSEDMFQSEYQITQVKCSSFGYNNLKVALSGILSVPGYMWDRRVATYPKRSGIDVLREIGGRHFRDVISDASESPIMSWVQTNQTDRSFVNDVMLRTHVDGSFPVMAITMDRQFRVRDFRSLVDQTKGPNWRWNLTNHVTDPVKDISLVSGSVFTANSGTVNSLWGYGTNRTCWDARDGGGYVSQAGPVSPLLVPGSLNRCSDQKSRVGASVFEDVINVPRGYWEMIDRNLSNWATFSSHSYDVTYHRQYREVRPLDVVLLSELGVGSGSGETSTQVSGLYVVTKVVQTLLHQELSTFLRVGRESYYNAIGDLR